MGVLCYQGNKQTIIYDCTGKGQDSILVSEICLPYYTFLSQYRFISSFFAIESSVTT